MPAPERENYGKDPAAICAIAAALRDNPVYREFTQ